MLVCRLTAKNYNCMSDVTTDISCSVNCSISSGYEARKVSTSGFSFNGSNHYIALTGDDIRKVFKGGGYNTFSLAFWVYETDGTRLCKVE